MVLPRDEARLQQFTWNATSTDTLYTCRDFLEKMRRSLQRKLTKGSIIVLVSRNDSARVGPTADSLTWSCFSIGRKCNSLWSHRLQRILVFVFSAQCLSVKVHGNAATAYIVAKGGPPLRPQSSSLLPLLASLKPHHVFRKKQEQH